MSAPTPRKAPWGLIGGAALVIAVPCLLIMISVAGSFPHGKERPTRLEIGSLKAAVRQYYAQIGEYPNQREGWSVLIEPPHPLEPLIPAEPLDEWQRPIRYVLSTDEGETYFEICSAGADGEWDTDDDICSSRHEAPIVAPDTQ